jgi:hypothetical protein
MGNSEFNSHPTPHCVFSVLHLLYPFPMVRSLAPITLSIFNHLTNSPLISHSCCHFLVCEEPTTHPTGALTSLTGSLPLPLHTGHGHKVSAALPHRNLLSLPQECPATSLGFFIPIWSAQKVTKLHLLALGLERKERGR